MKQYRRRMIHDDPEWVRMTAEINALGLEPNARDVAGVILGHGMDRLAAGLLAGHGGLNAQGFLGFSLPDPSDPDPDDRRGVRFFFGDHPETFMQGSAFMAYLRALNTIAPPASRASDADVTALRAVLDAAGVR